MAGTAADCVDQARPWLGLLQAHSMRQELCGKQRHALAALNIVGKAAAA
jgi:hypothetical protein